MYFALHKDNAVTVTRNIPYEKAVKDLSTETYGKIELSIFFFNMLKMTIESLKDMSKKKEDSKPTQKLVLDYSIINECDNEDFEFELFLSTGE